MYIRSRKVKGETPSSTAFSQRRFMRRRLLRNQSLQGWLLLPLVFPCLLAGCAQKDPLPAPSVEELRIVGWKGGIDSVLALGGELIQGELRQFEPKEKTEDVLLSGKPLVEHKTKESPVVTAPGYYRRIRRTFSYLGYTKDNDYISNLNEDVVWPGNLVYARSLQSQRIEGLSDLNEYRTPGKVSMAVVNGSKGLTRQITDYRFSEVNKQLNELVASNTEELPANLEYSIKTVRTLGEAAYYLRIPEQELKSGEKYKEFRSVHWQENTLKAVITFSQKFFTLVYDDPDGGASGLFTSQLTAEKLGKYTGVGNPLGFVSSVTYGRRFLAIIEETRRTYSDSVAFQTTIAKSLPHTDKIKELGAKSSEGAPSKKTQDIRNIRIYLRLEGGKDIFKTDVGIYPTMAELNSFLASTASGTSARYGIPISCTIKYLKGLKTVIVPRRIEGTYSYEDYEPEEDDNVISLSGLRLEGKCIDQVPRAYHNHYNEIGSSDCHLETVEIGYSLDNSKETTIRLPVKSPQKFKDTFSIPFPNQNLGTFGRTPKGYIRISIRGRYDVQRKKVGLFVSYSPWGHVPFSRNVYLRYNVEKHSWYVDSDHRGAGDEDFRRLRTYLDDQYCGVELMLHYRVNTDQRGTLPHSEL